MPRRPRRGQPPPQLTKHLDHFSIEWLDKIEAPEHFIEKLERYCLNYRQKLQIGDTGLARYWGHTALHTVICVVQQIQRKEFNKRWRQLSEESSLPHLTHDGKVIISKMRELGAELNDKDFFGNGAYMCFIKTLTDHGKPADIANEIYETLTHELYPTLAHSCVNPDDDLRNLCLFPTLELKKSVLIANQRIRDQLIRDQRIQD